MPRAAKTVIVLFFDRMFAFELKLTPPPDLLQLSSALHDEGLGSSLDGLVAGLTEAPSCRE